MPWQAYLDPLKWENIICLINLLRFQDKEFVKSVLDQVRVLNWQMMLEKDLLERVVRGGVAWQYHPIESLVWLWSDEEGCHVRSDTIKMKAGKDKESKTFVSIQISRYDKRGNSNVLIISQVDQESLRDQLNMKYEKGETKIEIFCISGGPGEPEGLAEYEISKGGKQNRNVLHFRWTRIAWGAT